MIAAIVAAVALVAIVGFASTRKGPFKNGAATGPVAVVASGLPSLNASPGVEDLHEDDLYPDLAPSVSAAAGADGEDLADPSAAPSPALGSASPVLGSTSPGPPPSWSSVIDELSKARVRIFEDPDRADMTAADRPGSSAYRADDASRALLAAQKLRARSLRFEIMTVNLVSETDPIVVLDVVDRASAYTIVDAQGRTVESRPARGPKQWRITIRRDQGRWRFVEITAATKGR